MPPQNNGRTVINLQLTLTELRGGQIMPITLLYATVRPKFGFGTENRNQGPISVSVSEANFFFRNRIFFFFKFFSFLPTSLGNISFYKIQNKPRS